MGGISEKFSSYFTIPVVDGGFIKLLPQLEGDLCVLEGALRANRHLVAVLADDHSRFGHVSDLSGGESHAWDTWETKHVSTLRPKTEIKANERGTLLTERFHVIVEILALHQFPGCTEGVDHGDGCSVIWRAH